MPIIGLTNRPPQFPCIGTLRKGAPKPERGPGRDLTYFRFDTDDPQAASAFHAAYGDEPRQVTVYLPYPSTDQNFQAWRESWTASKLNHRCDGEVVYVYDGAGVLVPTATPCPDLGKPDTDRNRCKQVGRLQVILPVLERFAYVTVLTSSIYDIIALSGQLAAIEALRREGLQGIPLILSRNEREISMPKPDGTRARVSKWMLSIEVAPEWAALQLQSMQRQALSLAAPALKALPSGHVIDVQSGEITESPHKQPPVTISLADWHDSEFDEDDEVDENNVAVATPPQSEQPPAPPAPEPTPAPVKLTQKQRADSIKAIRNMWREESDLGYETPQSELILDLEQIIDHSLVKLGQNVRARLADIKAKLIPMK